MKKIPKIPRNPLRPLRDLPKRPRKGPSPRPKRYLAGDDSRSGGGRTGNGGRRGV